MYNEFVKELIVNSIEFDDKELGTTCLDKFKLVDYNRIPA
jgi:hypothetical protein